MHHETATIRDDDGKVWTGPIVAMGRLDNRTLLWGILTGGLSLLFQPRGHVTIRVDGQLRSGLRVEPE
jgi:hypothetical protein